MERSTSSRIAFGSPCVARFLAAALCTTLMACSAHEGDLSDPTATEDATTTEQALTVTLNGYGVMFNGNRCWFDSTTPRWPGGRCHIPIGRTISYAFRATSCSGQFAADYSAAFQSAFNYVASELSLNGFKATLNGAGAVGVSVGCGQPVVGQNPAMQGGTVVNRVLSTDCSSITPGELCKYRNTTVSAYQSRIETGVFPSAVQSVRRVWLENIFRREMLRSAGLGNDLCGATPLTDLMQIDSCRDRNNPQTWRVANLVKFERDMLFAYRP